MDVVVLDPAGFARLLEITGDDVAFVDELVDTYLADATVQLESMHEAALADDATAMVRPAHSLKSSSENVGAVGLADACRSLETDGRAGAVHDAGARVAACLALFERVRAALLAERAAR